MAKLGKTIFEKTYFAIVLVVFYFFWAIPYLQINKQVESNIIIKAENFALLAIGITIFLLLLTCKNTKVVIPLILFIPFIFAHPFDAYTVPFNLYLIVGIVIIGMIIHLIRYREKFSFGRFFIGLLILCFSLMLGGIATKAEYFLKQLGFVALCSLGLLFFYSFFVTTAKMSFIDLARIITYLGVFILLQMITYYVIQENVIDSLLSKGIKVGWGVTNNIGLILLFTFPFTLYLAIVNKGIKTILYTMITFFQMVAILFTYSRGSISSLVIGLVFIFPVAIKYAKDKWSFLSTFNILLLGFTFLLVYTGYHYPEYFSRFYGYVLKIDLDSINGRIPIYQEILNAFKERPLFGHGMFAPFSSNSETYTWGHSTLLHTLYTAGGFGVGALLFHLGEKYYWLLRQINIEKIIIIFSFAMSGLYGLFDVSYYFMNYMILLIITMAVLEPVVVITCK